ncbi:MAG: STAS domain-containing protein [Pseudomonadota bacterium]
MDIDCRTEDDVLILTPQGERLDANCTVAFKERVHALTAGHPDRVMIDMGAVQFLDSSGLGALVAVMKGLGQGRRLELANCADSVTRVLALTRMDRVFVMHDDATPSRGNAA